jgi:hypothetical protein
MSVEKLLEHVLIQREVSNELSLHFVLQLAQLPQLRRPQLRAERPEWALPAQSVSERGRSAHR